MKELKKRSSQSQRMQRKVASQQVKESIDEELQTRPTVQGFMAQFQENAEHMAVLEQRVKMLKEREKQKAKELGAHAKEIQKWQASSDGFQEESKRLKSQLSEIEERLAKAEPTNAEQRTPEPLDVSGHDSPESVEMLRMRLADYESLVVSFAAHASQALAAPDGGAAAVAAEASGCPADAAADQPVSDGAALAEAQEALAEATERHAAVAADAEEARQRAAAEEQRAEELHQAVERICSSMERDLTQLKQALVEAEVRSGHEEGTAPDVTGLGTASPRLPEKHGRTRSAEERLMSSEWDLTESNSSRSSMERELQDLKQTLAEAAETGVAGRARCPDRGNPGLLRRLILRLAKRAAKMGPTKAIVMGSLLNTLCYAGYAGWCVASFGASQGNVLLVVLGTAVGVSMTPVAFVMHAVGAVAIIHGLASCPIVSSVLQRVMPGKLRHYKEMLDDLRRDE